MDTLVDFANTFIDNHVYDDCDNGVNVPCTSECLDSSSNDLIGCSTSMPNMMIDNDVSLDLGCSTSIDDVCESPIDHASSSIIVEFFAFYANDNDDLLNSLIRLRGIVDRIGATSFELLKIVIVERILSLVPSSKLFYVTLDLLMEKSLSVEDVIELLFKDEEIATSTAWKRTFKATHEASSSKGKEVALSSNFFDPYIRLCYNNFYNSFGARHTWGALSSSTTSIIPSPTPSTLIGLSIGVGGAPTTMLARSFEMINLAASAPAPPPPPLPPPQDHLWHLRRAHQQDLLFELGEFVRNPNDDLYENLLSIYDLVCRINSFRGLRKIAPHEVIDKLLQHNSCEEFLT
ncbi:hypothetical protein PR202_gb00045 [Eleusine coracana subsp. coracana]|uniref:Uncharacterized protein n=1 Tax=Eleusine coracana subsp. coracana TaxID=191504 RepID=A0AAV5DSL5_ELECO|nr:hypothetical protein PR202_gb00045 [Eleusine coracana subsp. coracana]